MENIKKKTSITWDDIEILIVGAGTMGASLVQAYAQSGFNVGVIDINEMVLEMAADAIDKELTNAQKAGIFSAVQVSEIKDRILSTTSYDEACPGKKLKLVIESATEDIEIKKKIFTTLDNLCRPSVILATNSSSLDTNILAAVTQRPDKIVWMHYFYLPHKNRAGEYAGTDTASPESIAQAAKYMKLAGKVATPILSSRKGGAADVIFVSLLLEASRLVEEGFDIPSIEAAGRTAYNMPLGFLGLMDATGIPLGIKTMDIFSDSSNANDPLYSVYRNFFSPPKSYEDVLKRFEEAEDKSAVKWVSPEDAQKKPGDQQKVDMLKSRFLAVGFMTAVECVDSGVIEMDEVDKLCQNAFLWGEGPFALMNKMGMSEVMRIVTERMELSHKNEINFPIPQLLVKQAQDNTPWPLKDSPIIVSSENNGSVVRIMISTPRSANALDSGVFNEFRSAFQAANADKNVKAIIFDSAPIKTFIAGANVSDFISNINAGRFQKIVDETAEWQDVLFHEMTGSGKPKVVIVDGTAFGGGVEVALAFAQDPDSIVIATERTSFTFPETRLGIYPGLRGTLTLPQVIYQKTKDPELAVALSRYYILAGGTTTASPRVLKHLGMADLLVPARCRDRVADVLVKAIIDNQGKSLTKEQIEALDIKELPSELTFAEKEELRTMKDLFLKSDLIPTLYAYGRGHAEVFFSFETKVEAQRIARRVANNSFFAVVISDLLISKGFDDLLKGISQDNRAQWELENYLRIIFEHPDAKEGLTALIERRFPDFNRLYPF